MSETTTDANRTAAVSEVLRLQNRLREAALSSDVRVFDELLSQNFVVNLPSNQVAHRDTLLELFASGAVDYSSGQEVIDHASELVEGLVVVMGTESTVAASVPSDSGLGDAVGKTLHRRFTNIWHREHGDWRLLVKQSTIFKIE